MPTKHTAEPWVITEKADRTLMVTAPAGWYIAKVCASTAVGKDRERPAANAARIVACVNACAGMEDPAGAIQSAKEFLSAIAAEGSSISPQARLLAGQFLRALGV